MHNNKVMGDRHRYWEKNHNVGDQSQEQFTQLIMFLLEVIQNLTGQGHEQMP